LAFEKYHDSAEALIQHLREKAVRVLYITHEIFEI